MASVWLGPPSTGSFLLFSAVVFITTMAVPAVDRYAAGRRFWAQPGRGLNEEKWKPRSAWFRNFAKAELYEKSSLDGFDGSIVGRVRSCSLGAGRAGAPQEAHRHHGF